MHKDTRKDVNAEGMTWHEFWRAAQFAYPRFHSMYQEFTRGNTLYDAWRRGEDPTEHAYCQTRIQEEP